MNEAGIHQLINQFVAHAFNIHGVARGIVQKALLDLRGAREIGAAYRDFLFGALERARRKRGIP